MSAHNRAANPSILSAPSHPRSGPPPRGYRDPRDYSGPPPPPRRNSTYGGPRGGPPPYAGPPTGPRGPPPTHHANPTFTAPTFRGSQNSTSTTYPRTQRFNNSHAAASSSSAPANPHLADLPEIVPGGRRLPELHDVSRAAKLEEEARRLREIIAEKQERKRKGLREWEALERESANASLRAELAEQSLRALDGEGDAGAAF